MEWLVNQDWFRERYPSINTLIVNNFHQPNDTPEHNQLVSCFLSNDFLMSFSYHILHDKIDDLFDDEDLNWLFHPNMVDKVAKKLEIDVSQKKLEPLTIPQRRNAVNRILENIEYKCEGPFYDFENIKFEHQKGADIVFDCVVFQSVEIINQLNGKTLKHIHRIDKKHDKAEIELVERYCGRMITRLSKYDFAIEVKPVLSDDYPSIIRQCRDQFCNVLFFDQFTATGATLDQVRKMFTDIYFVQKSDVEKLM